MVLHLLVASHHVLASPSSEGWPSRISVTRPNRVHAFALRLTPSSQGAPTARLLRAAAPSTSWRTSTYHVRYLSIEEISQALPGTPKGTKESGGRQGQALQRASTTGGGVTLNCVGWHRTGSADHTVREIVEFHPSCSSWRLFFSCLSVAPCLRENQQEKIIACTRAAVASVFPIQRQFPPPTHAGRSPFRDWKP